MDGYAQEQALRLPFLSIVVCLVAGPAAADAPFVPRSLKPPDYVITMVTKWYGGEKTESQVSHHDNWSRVTVHGSAGAVYHAADPVISLSAGDGGSWIRRGREPTAGIPFEPRNTGERQTHLGESCTIWETQRTTHLADNFSYLSCVTDDGIELWKRSVSSTPFNWSITATRLERRPVPAEEVRPPSSLFALDWLDLGAPTDSRASDYEAIMELSDGSTQSTSITRTIRRRGAWQFSEEIDGLRRQIEIIHDSHRTRWYFLSDKSGAPWRLTISRPAPAATEPQTPPKAFQPVAQDRHDTILGEHCRWFNMTPWMGGATTNACFTDDGIALKKEGYTSTSRQTWIATRVTRRPISIDEIKPPAELLQPQAWGID